jgi:CheY-like chemotaxis protein
MGTTILLVEDNPTTRKLVRFALEKHGFVVVEACDGGSAMQRFADATPALVLQDLMLPDVDGFELVTRLRALPCGRDVPILAFSGMLSKVEEARASAAGFNDVISKPTEPSRLLQIIRAHLPADGPAPDRFGDQRDVIVADDDTVQRRLVAFRLTKLGFRVRQAADGQEALDMARMSPPDLVLSDVLMPRLDGFELCLALRHDPRLAHTPIVLVTNSYVEPADRELARQVGAADLVLRTPELREVTTALRDSLGNRAACASLPLAELDGERVRRMMKQLERQVALNAGVNRRCTLLSAELSVLSAISEALAKQQDIDQALSDALAACFDAGGISMGALYLSTESGSREPAKSTAADYRVLTFGRADVWAAAEVESFFGDLALLESAARSSTITTVPASDHDERGRRVIERAGVTSMLVAPLVHGQATLGALLMVSASAELESEDRIAFAQAVAGQISHALLMAQAFSARERSEREARGQAAVLRSVLESIGDGVIVANARGEFILWNSAAEAITSLPLAKGPEDRARTYGLFEADMVTPVAAESLPLSRALRGEAVDGVEIFMRHEQATEGVWLSVNARPLREDGAARGGVAVFRDVTREKSAQAQLMVSDRMASVGLLAAGVAHEINNPLAAVLANLELAQRDVAEGALSDNAHELAEMLAEARNAAERVRQIARDLRIFSRQEDAPAGAVDVQRILESSLRMADNHIRHRARVVTDYRNVPPVEGTESRLGQVFLNLVVNAAQAIPEGNAAGHTIRVATRCEGGRVAIDIADSGCGIPPDTLRRLFTPFFTTKPAGIGTGLGLAICQRIITNLGGVIEVESEVGVGTTMRVLLPALRTSELGVDLPRPSAPPARRRARVLVVDDEEVIGSIVRRALTAEHEVVALTRASEALERIREGDAFDVILCDLMMPQMTGIEFYTALRTQARDQARRVIFLTGGAFTPAARAFLDGVSNQRVEKPFDVQHLRALVNDRIR